MNTKDIDTLGNKLGEAALILLVRLCPEIRSADKEQQEAACVAMRAQAKNVVEELLDEVRDAPGVAHIAFQSAALSLAQEGIWVLREAKK